MLQKKWQIAQEFSDLVVYCRPTPYNPEGKSHITAVTYLHLHQYSTLVVNVFVRDCLHLCTPNKMWFNHGHDKVVIVENGEVLFTTNRQRCML